MLTIKEPSTLTRPWRLSSCHEPKPVFIPTNLTQLLKNYHLIGIEFLYNNYKNGLNGCILNQEYDMNVHLEITAFLSAIFRDEGIVLIVSPDLLLYSWHYHLINHGKFNTKLITIDNFNTILTESKESQTILLITFSNLKLLETLDYQYFCVIIDEFDTIATKLILTKLKTRYNIGITYTNFNETINSKLRWKLLNWSNPGCVGQLSKFPQIDGQNFQQFRDNYHYWWLRLTWQFDAEHFRKPTQIERDDLKGIIENWTKLYFPNNNDERIIKKDTGKRKKIGNTRINNNENCGKRIVKRNRSEKKIDSGIVESRKKLNDYVQLPSMEEDPILTSIRKNFETTTPAPIQISNDNDKDKPTTSSNLKHSESEFFLFNLVGNLEDDELIDDKNEDLNERIQRTLKEADDLLGK